VYVGQRLQFVAGRHWNDPPGHAPAERAALITSERRLGALYDHVQAQL
jgi:hypothetical protein